MHIHMTDAQDLVLIVKAPVLRCKPWNPGRSYTNLQMPASGSKLMQMPSAGAN